MPGGCGSSRNCVGIVNLDDGIGLKHIQEYEELESGIHTYILTCQRAAAA